MSGTVAAALAALPDKRHEDWRYTDLSPLKARAWAEAAPQAIDVVFEGDAPLTKVVQLGGRDGVALLLTHRIALRPSQQATLVLHERGADVASLALHNLEVDLADNASLTLYRIQQPGAGTNLISRLDARVGRDARLTCVGLYAGGALVRNDLNVALEAPGASAELHGVLAPAAGEHLDVHTRLDHRAPHGTSRETFRCLVPAKARAIFNGKVIVHEGAQKTDSEQHVDSLLLAPGAEVNAKPELEIYADDVKCAHGATCGQLDEEALYYLRTRGLDLPSARGLLLSTFANAVLDRIEFAPARELAARQIAERFKGV
ncbi:MAG: SufB/SufD family protein [Gammaproteobacteria bacterium]